MEAVAARAWPGDLGVENQKYFSGAEENRKNPRCPTATVIFHFPLVINPPLPPPTPSPHHRPTHTHTFLQVYCTPGTYQFFNTMISAPCGEGYINLTRLSAADTPARRRRQPDPVLFLSNHFPTSIFRRQDPSWLTSAAPIGLFFFFFLFHSFAMTPE